MQKGYLQAIRLRLAKNDIDVRALLQVCERSPQILLDALRVTAEFRDPSEQCLIGFPDDLAVLDADQVPELAVSIDDQPARVNQKQALAGARQSNFTIVLYGFIHFDQLRTPSGTGTLLPNQQKGQRS
jgi:hypothetical protein